MYLLLLVFDFPNKYKKINCKLTNKMSVCNKLNHAYHNSLENPNQLIYTFTKTIYNVYIQNNKSILFEYVKQDFLWTKVQSITKDVLL